MPAMYSTIRAETQQRKHKCLKIGNWHIHSSKHQPSALRLWNEMANFRGELNPEINRLLGI